MWLGCACAHVLEGVHCILMCSPLAWSCAVNVYVLTAVKLWLVTFALAAASYSTINICALCGAHGGFCALLSHPYTTIIYCMAQI